MSDFPLFCEGCACVHPSPADWRAAVDRVVRPEQVRHLINRGRGHRPVGYRFPAGVAAFLKRQFDEGVLRYIADPAGCDLWCPPVTTIARGGGDCDDLAALALSLLLAGGADASMIVGTMCSHTCGGHAWVEGFDECGDWFLLEATSGSLLRHRPARYTPQYRFRPGHHYEDIRPPRLKTAASRQRYAARW